MGGCASVPKESDIVEVPTENVVVESKDVTTEADTTLTQVFLKSHLIISCVLFKQTHVKMKLLLPMCFDSQEKKEESSEEAKEEGETKEDSSEATKAEPTPEAEKADEKAPSETETPTQETAPAKTDEAPLVIL